MMQDRRRYHRLKVKLPACFQLGEKDNLKITSTLDISGTGLCISSRERMDIGKEFPLQVTLPNRKKVNINIKVVWIKEVYESPTTEFKMGVKIIEPLKADESKYVKYYVKELFDYFKKNKKP